MKDRERLVLGAALAMGALNAAQLRRFLFETDLSPEFDLAWTLAELREAGLLTQTVGESGIQYVLSPLGAEALRAEPLSRQLEQSIAQKAEEYRRLFAQEQNYLAQYSEQANGIIPVFLSIRQNEKVLFKISVIVHDVATAEKIKRHWMENAHRAYEETWRCIAQGEPLPVFD